MSQEAWREELTGRGGTEDTVGCLPRPHPAHLPAHMHSMWPFSASGSHPKRSPPPPHPPAALEFLPKKQVFPGLRGLGLPLYPSPGHLCQWESAAPHPSPVIPRMCFALPCGHRLLVMFTLMSYMLVSHGPSPLSQMSLWGDIPSLPQLKAC